MSIRDKIRAAVESVRSRQAALPAHVRRRMAPEPPPEAPQDASYRTALAGIADPHYILGNEYLDRQWQADRFEAHPRIVEFERLLIRRLRKLDVPMYAHCVWRSPDEQDAAFKRGVTKARAGQSPHNWGCAVDIVHCRKHWGLTERQWRVVGHVGKELAAQRSLHVTWGGDWKFWDPAHWELADWQACRVWRYSELTFDIT
nr:MAG: hypothetical protein [Microvirus sp.]